MDIEYIFLVVHLKVARFFQRYIPHHVRIALEVATACTALAGLMGLVALHVQHVGLHPTFPTPACLAHLNASYTASNAHVARIMITSDVSPRGDIVYEFGEQRGLFMLTQDVRTTLSVKEVSTQLSWHDPCLGDFIARGIMRHIVGYDTVMQNEVMRAFRRDGFLSIPHKAELLTLQQRHFRIDEGVLYMLLSKFELVVTVSFLFFAISALVSFTLRQTQSRMLRFAGQLRFYMRSALPTNRLVTKHVLESVAFVPGVVGILFFLFEFCGDHLVALTLMVLSWVCEFYAVINVRTVASMSYFPRVYASYFFLFGLYLFSFPTGFHHLALLLLLIAMCHAFALFYFHCEMPAVQSGLITAERPRMLAFVVPPRPEGPGRLRVDHDENLLAAIPLPQPSASVSAPAPAAAERPVVDRPAGLVSLRVGVGLVARGAASDDEHERLRPRSTGAAGRARVPWDFAVSSGPFAHQIAPAGPGRDLRSRATQRTDFRERARRRRQQRARRRRKAAGAGGSQSAYTSPALRPFAHTPSVFGGSSRSAHQSPALPSAEAPWMDPFSLDAQVPAAAAGASPNPPDRDLGGLRHRKHVVHANSTNRRGTGAGAGAGAARGRAYSGPCSADTTADSSAVVDDEAEAYYDMPTESEPEDVDDARVSVGASVGTGARWVAYERSPRSPRGRGPEEAPTTASQLMTLSSSMQPDVSAAERNSQATVPSAAGSVAVCSPQLSGSPRMRLSLPGSVGLSVLHLRHSPRPGTAGAAQPAADPPDT